MVAKSRFLRLAGSALAAALLSAPVAQGASAPANFRPFASDSVWNLPLRSDAPLSAKSRTYVQALQGSVDTQGAWINTTNCGMPIYWADSSTSRQRVTLNHPSYEDPALIRAWSSVPIPSNARPASCSDRNFAVIQPQSSGALKEWEFWEAARSPDGSWSAQWGGVINDLHTDRGIASPLAWQDPTAPSDISRHSTPGWNVTASSISMIAGVITRTDLASGHINHALAMAVPAAAARQWLWPAQRSDGYSSNPSALPEGAHLRLDPSLNLSALHLTPMVRMMAEAAQKYGIIVRDQTGSTNVFYAQQPDPGQSDPVASLLGGQSMTNALRAFPWSRLEVLSAPTCTDYRGCSAPQRAVIKVDGTPAAGSTVTLDTTNSVLNYPRTKVEWDLNGHGVYTSAGIGVTKTLRLTAPGTKTVAVRITTEDGSVISAKLTFNVGRFGARAAAVHRHRKARRRHRHAGSGRCARRTRVRGRKSSRTRGSSGCRRRR